MMNKRTAAKRQRDSLEGFGEKELLFQRGFSAGEFLILGSFNGSKSHLRWISNGLIKNSRCFLARKERDFAAFLIVAFFRRRSDFALS